MANTATVEFKWTPSATSGVTGQIAGVTVNGTAQPDTTLGPTDATLTVTAPDQAAIVLTVTTERGPFLKAAASFSYTVDVSDPAPATGFTAEVVGVTPAP